MFVMRSILSKLKIALVGGTLILATMPIKGADAAELLMFEEEWCHWCEQWNQDIGVIYDKTEEGQHAPLRRIDIHGTFPDGLVLTSRPQYTPTFILVDGNRELGRIEGYPGEDFFWGLLARLLQKLPENPQGEAVGQRPATN